MSLPAWKGGWGAGLRPAHYAGVLGPSPDIDWFEVITENFLGAGGKPARILEEVRSRRPIVFHGVGLSIASPDEPGADYLRALRELCRRFQPALVSDHLCWTRLNGENSHDLLPVPYTREALKRVAERIKRVQDALGRPIFLENPTAYHRFPEDEMLEEDFIAELSRQAGCGWVIDLNNLHVNSMNLGIDPLQWLERIARVDVGYFHLAGHFTPASGPGLRIDTHDRPVSEEVWKLYEWASSRFKTAGTLIEWDDALPTFERLQAEVTEARRRHGKGGALEAPRGAWSSSSQLSPASFPQPAETRRPRPLDEIQAEFWNAVTGPDLTGLSPGLTVYRSAYFARLLNVLKELFPTLLYIVEDEGMEALAHAYLLAHRPRSASIRDVGNELPQFLRAGALPRDYGVEGAVLADLAALDLARARAFDAPDAPVAEDAGWMKEVAECDWAALRPKLAPSVEVLELSSGILPVWKDAVAGRSDPEPPEAGRAFAVVYRHGEEVFHESLGEESWFLLAALREGLSFEEICFRFSVANAVSIEQSVNRFVLLLREASGKSWLLKEPLESRNAGDKRENLHVAF